MIYMENPLQNTVQKVCVYIYIYAIYTYIYMLSRSGVSNSLQSHGL